MPANAFDDLPAGLTAAAAAPTTPAPGATGKNAFDDITPPVTDGKPPKPPVTAADRVQAGEAGFLKGAAYLAGLPADALMNTENLARAGIGAAYLGLGGKPSNMPAWLDPASDPTLRPNPSGSAISELMDKSPVTTTQAARPDDPASRYLSTAMSVVPGVLSAGGGLSTVGAAAAPAMAGQYVAEAHPFKSDTANTAAAVLTQALGAAIPSRAPVASRATDQLAAAQEAGYVVPPSTTNPGSPVIRTIEGIAGKTAVQQHAAIQNQGVTNNLGRAAIGLPERQGPITPEEIVEAKQAAAPGYDAMRGAGQIVVPMDWTQRLTAALSKQSGAAKLDPSLADSTLNTTVANLTKLKNFDAGDAMDTIDALRDRASGAFQSGNAQAGRAYKATSKVIEDAIDFDLSRSPQTADTVQNFRDSRARFAAIANVEENRNPTTGNLQAQKLAAALRNKEYLGGDGAPLQLAAESAGIAPKAFAEPSSSPVNHLNVTEGLVGGALGEHAFGPVGLAAAAGIPLGRWAARQYVLGAPGQRAATPTQLSVPSAGRLAGALTAAPSLAVAASQ